MPDAHAARRGALLAALPDREAVLVTRLVNVRYLTGFTGSHATLLLRPDRPALLGTDGRYTIQAGAQAPDVELLVDRESVAALARRAEAAGVRRLTVEAHDLTLAVAEDLAGDLPRLRLDPVRGAVEALREVKDDAELDLLRAACAAADRALADLLAAGGLCPGRTERAVRDDLEARLRGHGADGPSFETIVAAGPNSAVPHHRPTGRVLARGDLVKLDFGALLAGYHSDMTRTVVLGPPADWQRDLHALVTDAQRAGRAALTVDADVVAVDRAARSVVERAGEGERFPHGLGHGVGLEVHEAPMVGPLAVGRLRAGMPVTVEPGVYLPGRGGVRIEDTLLVRPAGPELFTQTTKDLLVL